MNNISLYPGVTLCFVTYENNMQHTHYTHEHILEINYCHEGNMGWELENGSKVLISKGDFSVHTTKTCSNAQLLLPSQHYSGIQFLLDLETLKKNTPDILKDTEVSFYNLYEKFCQNGTMGFFSGNEETETIFSFFLEQPTELQLAYYRIKFMELVLYLLKQDRRHLKELTPYQAEQLCTIRQIHDDILQHLDERVTIETLAQKYLINATTLKTLFKSVYGDSLASHIKKHRMEQAAKLLLQSTLPLSEIARKVGYESQSKFTAAFKSHFSMLPSEYRKKF